MSFPLSTVKTDRADSFFKHGVGMSTSLLTADGFPRADIDVAQSENVNDLGSSSWANAFQYGPPELGSSISGTTTRT